VKNLLGLYALKNLECVGYLERVGVLERVKNGMRRRVVNGEC